MFENLLPENVNGKRYYFLFKDNYIQFKLVYLILVFATTAANSEESSYACYYDDKLGTYLGDLYSVNWMEDSDRVSYLSFIYASN